MADVTEILAAVEAGRAEAAAQLLPLVYDELRAIAAAKLRREQPGQSLDATALVHEAYLRLAGGQSFANRRHFFAAAAEAMRRILVDRARARQAQKRGGDGRRLEVELDQLQVRYSDAELIDIDSLLGALARTDGEAAELVRQHVFGGLSLEQAGALLGMSRATAYRNWAFARAWLRDAVGAAERS